MDLDLLVVTNAITDKVYNVPQDFLERLGLNKGSENHAILRLNIAEHLQERSPLYESPAGSPANVGFSDAVLGLRTGLIGAVGDDPHGFAYKAKLQQYDIQDHVQTYSGESGICYTFITEDGERTFLSLMNLAPRFDLTRAPVQARALHTSCYEVVGKENDFLEYLSRGKKAGAKISLDLADPKTCRKIGEKMPQLLDLVDILFASPEEYEAAVGEQFSSPKMDSFKHEVLCLKFGKDGSRIVTTTEDHRVPIFPATIVNTNGAGDSYAAGFLSSYLTGHSLLECGTRGSEIASRVISQVGACLPGNKK